MPGATVAMLPSLHYLCKGWAYHVLSCHVGNLKCEKPTVLERCEKV